ncbi:MAG: signal peptidase II [Verrucomicrobiales bacterium]|nr:signal peptidase II [Verrucomicrobiales bacterium]
MKYIFGISIPLFILDQLTKFWILKKFPNVPPPHEHDVIIPGFFNLTRVHNTGMAFGMLNGNPFANYIFGAIGIAALTVITILWRRNAFPDRLSKTAVALLVSGILGNFTDRIIPGRGYVVDFLDFQLPFWHLIDKNSGGHFPSFNVADSCICIAAGLMIFGAVQGMREEAAAKKAEA